MAPPSPKSVDELSQDLVLTNGQLSQVSTILLDQFKQGLSRDGHATADTKMFPTYVRDVPNGSEAGKFLALDLGGTNFRVLLVQLGKEFHMENHVYPISQETMGGSGEQLFDHIASCLHKFIAEFDLKGNKLPLGFTFSFPCIQDGLTAGRLVQWTKGFNCSGCVGQDVVQLLRDAIGRRNDLDSIDVTALVNDTTGTLMSCAFQNHNCLVGLIIGTGTNACYMEDLNEVETFTGEVNEPKQVIVNIEWGNFGKKGGLDFVRTKWDFKMDDDSLHPTVHIFEKMTSGMYLGELVRMILEEATDLGLMFPGVKSAKLRTPDIIDTSFVSHCESEQGGSLLRIREELNKLDITNPSNEDCLNVRMICERVSTRSAHLLAAATATIVNRLKKKDITIGIDGSVYRYHPHYHQRMESKMKELVRNGLSFKLELSEDGSGRGAALVAAVAVREQKRLQK